MVRRTICVAVLSLLAAVAGLAASPQAPAPSQANQPLVRTSSVMGQVVDGDSGDPISGAVVQMRSRTLAAAQPAAGRGGRGQGLSAAEQAAASGQDVVMADSSGRFVFHNLPKGPVQLTATAGGYVDVPGAAPRPVQITADGQHLSDIKVRLVRVASITGTITDEAGEPLVGVSVRAVRREMPAGSPRYNLTGNARTDDRGVYRLDGLVPGSYFVVLPQTQTTMPVANVEKQGDFLGGLLGGNNPLIEAITGGAQASFTQPGVRVGDQVWQPTMAGLNGMPGVAAPPPINGRVAAYQTTFYPGVTQMGQAMAVALKSGDARQGVDWQVRPSAVARITGLAMGPDGPAQSLQIRLVNAPGSVEDDALPVATATTAADGSFVFLGVPTGNYVAKAQLAARGNMPSIPAAMLSSLPPGAMEMLQGRMGGAGGEQSFLRAPISVGDRDVTGVTVSLRPGAKVSGRVVFEGGSAPTPQQLANATFNLISQTGGAAAGAAPPVKLTADLHFTTGTEPPGNYMANLGGLGAWLMKSVTVGGRDAMSSGIDVADSDIADVVVTLTDRIASLTGSVTQTGSGPLPNSTVVILPADFRAAIGSGALARRQFTLSVTPAGTYTAGRMMPGDYLVVAVTDDVLSGDRDAALYEALARAATSITIGEGEKRSLNLTISRVSR